MKAFLARFSAGRCGLCSGPIEEGDEVGYLDDELVHAECAKDEGEEIVWD